MLDESDHVMIRYQTQTLLKVSSLILTPISACLKRFVPVKLQPVRKAQAMAG
jgi:hypothetical protein